LDLLGGLNREQLRIIPWIVAAVFVLVAGLWRPRRLHWTALGSVLLFAALNAGAGIYVLNHFRDSRWSTGGEPTLSAPSFSGTPIVGQFLGPLDSTLNGVVGGVNEFLAFKQALPIALDFLAVSGWALLLSFPLAIVAAVVSYAVARRRTAEFEKYRATVDLLKDELEQVKRQISSGPLH
jgi:disulfide bond formation protein DsbB